MTENVARRSAPNRFEISVDGRVAGFAEFVDRDGVRIFPHTEIDPEFGGQGLGGTVVRAALEATRAEGLSIVAQCSFVRHYVETHPEWSDLLAADQGSD